MNKTHGSLFSGFDAPSVAASWLGWKNAFHCEINSFCNEILKYWFPDSEHYEDITKTDFSQWKGRIDVLTGGFPCQPFSLAGQRKGAYDNRYLWPEMLRAIREIRPTWVIGENVAGILTMVQPGEETEMGSQTALFGEDNRKRVLLRQEYVVETICKDLEREGYSVQPLLIPACAVGAPHRRDRVWFVAHRNDAPHPDLDRCRNGKNKQEPLTQCKGTSNNCFSSKDGVVTYSQCPRSGQIRKKVQSKQSDGNSFDRNGGKRDVANTKSKQSERDRLEQPKDCATEQRESGRSSSENNSKYATRGWKNFPTQSPVCRGNDGVPFNVDNLTIPFTKWRQESVKGYGNAIVPQVILEIFKAIEELDN